MDDKEKLYRTGDFNLDDILKEFGGEAPAEPEEDVRIWGEPSRTVESTQGDTVRLDDVIQAVRRQENEAGTGETVRFTPVGAEPVRSTPVEEPETVTVYQPARQEPEEPFSERWEPEYEEPINDYIPPQPIVFRPKNRLRELKRKLIEGPEKRYYELEEMGTGKLQAAIFFSLLVTLASAFATAMYQLALVGPERLRLLVYVQFLTLLLSALLGSYQLIDGIHSLLKGRFNLNTMLIFSLLACCVDSILCLQQLRVPACSVFCAHMTMSLWGGYQKRSTEQAQMDTMRKAVRLDGLVLTEDYFEGRPGYLRCEGQVEDFMDYYDEPSGPEKVLSIYAVVALLGSLGCGILAGVLYDLSRGLQIFSIALLVAVPVSAHVTLSRPAALLQRRLKKHGSVICGWQGVRGLCRAAAFPLTATDIFPGGSAKLNGVKFYGSRDPDDVVAYAAAVMEADGGTMAPLMTQLLESRSGYHYDVTELQSYPGGIGGIVDGEAVLAGTLGFMQNMGVEMPQGTKVNQAVYVAIDGHLAGVFAVTYSKVKSAAVGLTTLCSYRRLTPVMVTGDFMLTESFLRSKFGVNTKRMAFPPRNVRTELAQRQADPETVALAMTTREDLASFAYAVTGSRALRSASIAGTTVQLISGILGLLIVIALMLVDAGHLLTPGNILLYELLWLIPSWLITEWTRSV